MKIQNEINEIVKDSLNAILDQSIQMKLQSLDLKYQTTYTII